MNSFYHFGDSFVVPEVIGFKLARHFDCEYKQRNWGGITNEQILHMILDEYDKIKKNDIVLINFTFLIRFYNLNENFKLISTNELYFEMDKYYSDKYYTTYSKQQKHFDYYWDCSLEYNIKLFKIINRILNNLISRGVLVFCVPIKKDDLTHMGKTYSSKEYSLDIPNELEFEPSFFDWLKERDYLKGEIGHYSLGTEDIITEEYIHRMKNIINKISTNNT
jgi:hypothetical protein